MKPETFMDLLDKIKSSGLLVITISGVAIIILALMVNFYPQLIPILLDDSNYSLKVLLATGWIVLSLFFGTVVLYIAEGLAKERNARRSQAALQRELEDRFRNLPSSYKTILRNFINVNRPFADFDTHNSLIHSAVSDLERQGILYQDNTIGSQTYHIHLEFYTFLKKNPELLND